MSTAVETHPDSPHRLLLYRLTGAAVLLGVYAGTILAVMWLTAGR